MRGPLSVEITSRGVVGTAQVVPAPLRIPALPTCLVSWSIMVSSVRALPGRPDWPQALRVVWVRKCMWVKLHPHNSRFYRLCSASG
jgi:hypothetical protein